jgi:Pyruvate/2-oxoacid:ferredoxin oxidoreductase delta subunit
VGGIVVNTVIQVDRGIIGPREPRPRCVRVRRLSDFPRVSSAHRVVAKRLSSPLLLGPPICQELIDLVEHTFTEDEADLVQHLRPARGRSAADLARRVRRPVEVVQPILDGLAFTKRAIGCDGSVQPAKYRLLPIMPGIFEMVLIGQSPETLDDWHRRFAELVEALYETGYLSDYQSHPGSLVRFLPVSTVAGGHPLALPSDRLEVVLDQFDVFGIGHCQCRMSTPPTGAGCGRPLEVCTAMGQWAHAGIAAGWLRSVSRRELLDIKRHAESQGLVTWIMNVHSTKGQASCSCCGCCCRGMRLITEFNAPGMMAPPHFMPRFDRSACVHCGACAKACPTAAITVDTRQKTLAHQPARCIGCGLCQLACERQHAIDMEPVPEYRVPYKSWFSWLMHNASALLRTSWSVWRQR